MSHPYFFTWQAQNDVKPMALTGGDGAFFECDGRSILDFGSLSYQVNAGHGQKAIVEAIVAQANQLCVASPSADYPAKRELAERLLAKAPPEFSKVFFSLGGAEANENALKIARMATGKYKLVSRYRSYHGATLGAVSATGDWRRTAVEPGIVGAIHVMDLDEGITGTQVPRVLELEQNVGAVILEPIVGANGVLIPEAADYAAIREACDHHNALLIMDEIFTGFGRTGRYFGYEHFGVVPDLITVAKGLTSGYGALSAVLVHERVAQHFDENVLTCGLTNYAHPLGVAAALAAMNVYEKEKLVENAAELETPLRARLTQVTQTCRSATGFRVRGLLAALDLSCDDESLAKLRAALWSRDLYTHVYGSRQYRRPGGCLIIAPPLCITQTELELGMDRIASALKEVFS